MAKNVIQDKSNVTCSTVQLQNEIEATRVEIEALRSTLFAKENYLNELKFKLEQKKQPTSSILSNEEKTRYSRQLILPGFGMKSQEKLKRFGVLIVGAGGLGCPAAQYLAAAGIGKIGFVDYDEVERTNLHRQILHKALSIGVSKAESARKAIEEINPYTKVFTYNKLANSSNIISIITDKNYDIVLDCSDNVATRYLLNDACVILKRPLVSGSALQLDGQLTVYNFGECCPCYRCLFPVPPPPESVTNCGDGGVLGAVTGVVGTLQALEAIKIATQLGEVLAGRLLLFDGARCTFRSIKLRGRRIDCNICSIDAPAIMLEDYEQFCGMRASDRNYALDLLQEDERLSVQEYQTIVKQNQDHLLIDVRSPTEFDICKLPNSCNVPLKDVLNDEYLKKFKNELSNPESKFVLLCRRGNDSQIAVQHMRNRFPQHYIRDIAGGLHAWHFEIDKDFPIY